jgi:hypothetical protein
MNRLRKAFKSVGSLGSKIEKKATGLGMKLTGGVERLGIKAGQAGNKAIGQVAEFSTKAINEADKASRQVAGALKSAANSGVAGGIQQGLGIASKIAGVIPNPLGQMASGALESARGGLAEARGVARQLPRFQEQVANKARAIQGTSLEKLNDRKTQVEDAVKGAYQSFM